MAAEKEAEARAAGAGAAVGAAGVAARVAVRAARAAVRLREAVSDMCTRLSLSLQLQKTLVSLEMRKRWQKTTRMHLVHSAHIKHREWRHNHKCQHYTKSEHPNGAMEELSGRILQKASTHAGSVGVDIAVVQRDCAAVDADATSVLPNNKAHQ